MLADNAEFGQQEGRRSEKENRGGTMMGRSKKRLMYSNNHNQYIA